MNLGLFLLFVFTRLDLGCDSGHNNAYDSRFSSDFDSNCSKSVS